MTGRRLGKFCLGYNWHGLVDMEGGFVVWTCSGCGQQEVVKDGGSYLNRSHFQARSFDLGFDLGGSR